MSVFSSEEELAFIYCTSEITASEYFCKGIV